MRSRAGVTAGFFIMLAACTGADPSTGDGSGGSSSGSGSTGSGTGGATGSSSTGVGGSSLPSGGASAGGSSSSGGASAGGNSSSGGSSTGGTSSTGGAGGSSGGSTGSGGTGPAPGCNPDCGSHKWACWPMPNPVGSGLPNEASYTVADGVVHDNVTCLDWVHDPDGVARSTADAIAYCEGLSLGGFDDWRVPTRVEMASIMDWTRSNSVDTAFSGQGGFHKTGSNWVLTIDGNNNSGFSWAYNMSDGIVSNARTSTTADQVRCVRGNGSGEGFDDHAVPPPNQYTVISDDEVQDNYTGLIWERNGEASGLVDWEGAVAYCDALDIGGHEWRLPSIRELATLVDEADVAPSINEEMFPNTHYGSKSDNWYWASHRRQGSDTASWGLNFDDGFTGFNAGAAGAWNYWTLSYAKCVR